MSNEKILKKAIEKAVKNGWRVNWMSSENSLQVAQFVWNREYLSHDFAKAFWGEKLVSPGCTMHSWLPNWQYHLQLMVIESDPIKYLEQFI